MQIHYNTKSDLLYIQIDENATEVINKDISEGVVLDIGEEDRIVGIEILDASKRVKLDQLLPVKYHEETAIA